jgi:hypothetical protein
MLSHSGIIRWCDRIQVLDTSSAAHWHFQNKFVSKINLMKKYNHPIRKATQVLLLAGLIFFGLSVRAQCPTDIAPTNINWIGPFTSTVLMPGTTDCYLTFTYCDRTVNGVGEYYIASFGPDPNHTWGSDCNNLTWNNMLSAIREQLFQSTYTPPCTGPGSGTLVTVRVFSGQCVSFVMQSSVASCNFCSGAYCKKQCDLCYDVNPPHHKTESNCQISAIGSASCTAISGLENVTYNDVAGNWTQSGHSYSTCYFLGCDNTQ